MHFSKFDIELFYFLFNIFFPLELCVECHVQVFSCIRIRNFLRIYFTILLILWFVKFRWMIDFLLSFICHLFIQLFTAWTALYSLLFRLVDLLIWHCPQSYNRCIISKSFDFDTVLVYNKNKTDPRTLSCSILVNIFF